MTFTASTRAERIAHLLDIPEDNHGEAMADVAPISDLPAELLLILLYHAAMVSALTDNRSN